MADKQKALTKAQQDLLEKIRTSRGVTCLRGREIATGQVLVKRGLVIEVDQRSWQVLPAGVAGWVEAGLVCQACAGDAPRGKCLNPKCVGGPIVRELVPADEAGVTGTPGGQSNG
jgi:hypothetical protein